MDNKKGLNFLGKNLFKNIAQQIPQQNSQKIINVVGLVASGIQKVTEEIKKQQQKAQITIMDTSIFFDPVFKLNLQKMKKKIILSILYEISLKQGLQPQQIDISSFISSDECIKNHSEFIQQQLESHSDQKNTKEWNLFSFYYFITTYFVDKANYKKNNESCGPTDSKLKDCIQYFMENLTIDKVKEKIEDIQKTIKEETQIDYEESYESQPLIPYFQSQEKHQYSDYFKKFKMDRIKLDQQELKEEEDFLNDLIECYEIWGNMILIDKYRNNRVLLYLQFLDSYLAQESTTNLIKKYEISEFKFFDKFDILSLLIHPEYISTLKQDDEDEIYFYFLLICLLNLIKYNYLVLNKEQKLVKLIEKIKSFDNIKFKLGYQFLLRLMIDFQEKLTLSESNDDYISYEFENQYKHEFCQKSLVQLFKEWTQEKYQVQEKYINKKQLQLYIDSAQSALILAILPDLVRFYDINEKIPYQPTNIDVGYVQQIVRGKRLFDKKPLEKEKNLTYWEGLIKNILNVRDKEFRIKNSNNNMIPSDENQPPIFSLTICRINLLTLQLLYKSENQNEENSSEAKQLREQIEKLIQQIGSYMYQNIYRQRQFYQTLCSLLIKENSIMNYLINQIIKNKTSVETYYQSQQFKNLILSFRQDIDIRNFINMRLIRNFSLQSTDETFERLRDQFLIVHDQFIKQTIVTEIKDLEDTKQQFQNIIKYYGFLNRKKYEAFKINIQMYIKLVELIIELKSPSQYSYLYDEIKEISSSQFIVKKVKLKENGGRKVALKQPLEEEKDYSKQQMREISILSNLPKNNLIIQYVGHQKNNKQFQIFLEYFKGETLFSFIKKLYKSQQFYDQNQKLKKLKISKQILQAIEYLHEHNIVHGDIKLSNILINARDEIKIIDFSESGFLVEEIIGFTEDYDAKDNFKTRYIDYYSLGILLIRIFYSLEFKILCNCGESKKCKLINHEEFILQATSKIDEQGKNQYSQIFFDQIKSLLNDQPYLRCTLKELIYIIDLEIEIIDNNFTETQRQECEYKYFQKYGKIIDYKNIVIDRTDMIQNLLYEINNISTDQINQGINYPYNYSVSESQNQNEINEENKQQDCEKDLNQNQLFSENNNNSQEKNQSVSKIENEFFYEEQTIKKGIKNHNNQIQLRKISENSQYGKEKLNLQQKSNSQNWESKSLENYFIDKFEKKENDMILIYHLRQLNINFRNLEIDVSKFRQSTRVKIKYILETLIKSKTLTIEKVLLLISDQQIRKMLNELIGIVIQKQDFSKDQKNKIKNYFLQFKE
ncbi:Serine/Threonine kinase domain protein (macronuclear) [Tetrahymena thermophila SB210]|uniref:Serine/Threonine kinase domain protein n=1 Tax=Tetrahymena thermophila (strain SB210) TaxID=312017 RepID=Q237M9_TETTS|nr:Serine/Threonine kinase domain protein [Tetrahymena thermophila SB210]EAR92712.2 Serine/Threonine kinase domain protein [Tetrahymena thermophila SB210]|eukprot:XP_001012957.2 Serine/Threonine kinase domain protein [Tetrahymena thermophila SB210]